MNVLCERCNERLAQHDVLTDTKDGDDHRYTHVCAECLKVTEVFQPKKED